MLNSVNIKCYREDIFYSYHISSLNKMPLWLFRGHLDYHRKQALKGSLLQIAVVEMCDEEESGWKRLITPFALREKIEMNFPTLGLIKQASSAGAGSTRYSQISTYFSWRGVQLYTSCLDNVFLKCVLSLWLVLRPIRYNNTIRAQ